MGRFRLQSPPDSARAFTSNGNDQRDEKIAG
jgi:hypothetical protein